MVVAGAAVPAATGVSPGGAASGPQTTAEPEYATLTVDAVRATDGRTRLARVSQRFPQRVTAPMYLDEADPGMAFVCVQNPTAGAFPGDRLRTSVELAEGARLHLTGQAATQVFAGAGDHTGESVHVFDFDVREGAVLEYLPKSAIPHAGARYRQSTEIRIADGAVYLGWESLAAGRIGHGERFAFESFVAATSVRNGARLGMRDVVKVVPAVRDPRRLGLLAGHDYVASFLALAPGRDTTALVTALHQRIETLPGVLGACSALPAGLGVAVRLLASRAPALHTALRAVWSVARTELLGRPAPMTRM